MQNLPNDPGFPCAVGQRRWDPLLPCQVPGDACLGSFRHERSRAFPSGELLILLQVGSQVRRMNQT